MGREVKILTLVTDAFDGGGVIAQYNRDFMRALGSDAGVDKVDVLPLLPPRQASVQTPEQVRQ